MFKKMVVVAMLVMSITLVFNTACSKKGDSKPASSSSDTM